MFISFLYMFRATMCPPSGETTVFVWHLVLVILYGWLVCTLHTRQSSIQSDKYQVSNRYGCFSWWWADSRPKHLEKKINIQRKIVREVGFIYKMEKRVAWWVPNATNTHTDCAIVIVFPLQRWLHERASMLRYMYIRCLVLYQRSASSWLS